MRAKGEQSFQHPLILYSTNTRIAHMIAKHYYNNLHYAWCSPFSGSPIQNAFDRVEPPSSSPLRIYRSLHDDVTAPDLHSDKISQNRSGLIRGASAKRQAGVIDEDGAGDRRRGRASRDQFLSAVALCHTLRRGRCTREAGSVGTASPSVSEEYIIESLPRAFFDIVVLPL